MCLFVVQYRNSDFTRMKKMRNAKPWRDGFLIDSLRGFSFYGLISPKRLAALLAENGFEIVDQRLDNGRVFMMGRSLRKPWQEVEIVNETNFRVCRRQAAAALDQAPGRRHFGSGARAEERMT
jgi:hypothetical protein